MDKRWAFWCPCDAVFINLAFCLFFPSLFLFLHLWSSEAQPNSFHVLVGLCNGKIHMLLPFSHIGFVFYSVYCLATLLFLSVVYDTDLCAWVSHLTIYEMSSKLLTFVLGSAAPSSSVASKCKLFRLGNLPTFFRVNQNVNLGTLGKMVTREKTFTYALFFCFCLMSTQATLCVTLLGKHYLIWLFTSAMWGRMGYCINSSVKL